MFTIQISEFCEYTLKDFTNLLSIQNETKFKIIIPKPVMLPSHSKDMVGNIYALAAYAGHLLADVSDKFGYYIPSPFTANHFYFSIETDKYKDLALHLFIITSVYFASETYDFKVILTLVNTYLNKVDNGNINCSAIGLFAITKCF